MFPLKKGQHARQAHVGLPEGTYEEEHGREGFYGRVSQLYHKHPPTSWTRIEGPLKPRAINCADMPRQSAREDDPFGEPVTFLYNDDVALKVARPGGAMPYYTRNADGDDVYFIHQGAGLLETDYGPLRYERGDYLVIPRGTTYRMIPDGATGTEFYLLIESSGEIRSPESQRGMMGRQAQFDMGVVETPEPQAAEEGDLTGSKPGPDGKPEWEVRVKRESEYTSVFYPFNPFDVVGWQGDLTPMKLNIKDYRPVMSHRVHLPPSVHTTWLGENFVVCSFVPRPTETGDPQALKVPFYHRNIDYDEVIFYHAGNFFSRHGIGPAMITWHPQGVHHGPHPKAFERGKTLTETDEYAVMLDARHPLKMTQEAQKAEWAEYHLSWSK